MPKGLFVTLEGGEGAGKSTLARALQAELIRRGREVVLTREPGGTLGAEEIRALLVKGDTERWSAMTEALLFYAARVDHVEKVIQPAIARGAIVISDRFADSTMAYQGAAGGIELDRLKALHRLALNDFQPALTLLVDIPPETGLNRTRDRLGLEVRFESKALAFHERLRACFHRLAAEEPDRFVTLNGQNDPGDVADAALQALLERLKDD
ncbi:dTMP kinase [Hyphobacterium sp. CCMP332]|uniref:dTMP kinase n=1 Tax=Hyphobacterium sp. CCMP332 TaxID=2749086 RepID=UPI00164EF6C1|nr:dTMP kinase [Hyphobacterium sp. CCMP332]QNL18722.1 dTMP kinase [Hyphobacterium sp. CCMP332]